MKIIGTGSAFPGKKVSNEDMSKIVDTSDEWIYSRTGIHARCVAEPEERMADYAARAASTALEDAGIAADEIDLIIAATSSADYVMPNAACLVQEKIGAVNAAAFDLNGACSGFILALNTAQAYLQAGIYDKILLVGAEKLSRILDWKDRGTCVLFGDGAGAAVVQRDERLFEQVQYADGTGGKVLTCAADGKVQMDGQEVFKFAVRKVPQMIREIVKKAGVEVEEVDHFLLHQANIRIIEAAARRLKVPMEKFPSNLEHYGNTSAATIPILIDEEKRAGRLKDGDLVLAAGFGAGLTWAASLFLF